MEVETACRSKRSVLQCEVPGFLDKVILSTAANLCVCIFIAVTARQFLCRDLGTHGHSGPSRLAQRRTVSLRGTSNKYCCSMLQALPRHGHSSAAWEEEEDDDDDADL